MFGAIIGDILGSSQEFYEKQIKSKKYREMTFTDDTILTIASMDSIMNNFSYEESYKSWAKKYLDKNKGFGGMFKKWVKDEADDDYQSFGNGGAMRISPLALTAKSLNSLEKEIEKSCSCTHGHPDGISGAKLIAMAIFLVKQGNSKYDVKCKLEKHFNISFDKKISELDKSSTLAKDSTYNAFICFLEGTSFFDTMMKAISLGGDTDTVASMSGAIAEFYYPRKEIKAQFSLLVNYLDEDTKRVLEDFYFSHYKKERDYKLSEGFLG